MRQSQNEDPNIIASLRKVVMQEAWLDQLHLSAMNLHEKHELDIELERWTAVQSFHGYGDT